MPPSEKAPKGYRDVLLRVLGDGEWHTFQQIYYALESRIDPQDASKAAAELKESSNDLNERLRYGKESVVAKALSGLRVEQQGFRHDRSTRKYRLRPDMQQDVETVRVGARIAFRALLAVPGMRDAFKGVLEGRAPAKTAIDLMPERVEANPAQRYWLELALSPEADDAATPFDDEETTS